MVSVHNSGVVFGKVALVRLSSIEDSGPLSLVGLLVINAKQNWKVRC